MADRFQVILESSFYGKCRNRNTFSKTKGQMSLLYTTQWFNFMGMFHVLVITYVKLHWKQIETLQSAPKFVEQFIYKLQQNETSLRPFALPSRNKRLSQNDLFAQLRPQQIDNNRLLANDDKTIVKITCKIRIIFIHFSGLFSFALVADYSRWSGANFYKGRWKWQEEGLSQDHKKVFQNIEFDSTEAVFLSSEDEDVLIRTQLRQGLFSSCQRHITLFWLSSLPQK